MKEYFFKTCHYIQQKLQSGEEFSVYYQGELSHFCRLNLNSVRQWGSCNQHYITLRLYAGGKQAFKSMALTADIKVDQQIIAASINKLRVYLSAISEDPFLVIPRKVQNTEQDKTQTLAKGGREILALIEEAMGMDLVGIYSHGDIFRAFADSRGQRNWFGCSLFNLDFSIYEGGNAVKGKYAGRVFDYNKLKETISSMRKELLLLNKAPKKVMPGKYRVYLAPSALESLVDMLSWGAFGRRNIETKKSPLLRLLQEKDQLCSSVSITEDLGVGLTPCFDSLGFIKPKMIPLIEKGKFKGALTSARTEKEFSLEGNTGANKEESPESLRMAPGTIETDKIKSLLGGGLYINNLWYLNYSDRANCRLTGMTRYATFWVENGEIVAPVGAMRFDETIYKIFGKSLCGLTKETELLLSSSTYNSRSTRSVRVPGALIDDFSFTL